MRTDHARVFANLFSISSREEGILDLTKKVYTDRVNILMSLRLIF